MSERAPQVGVLGLGAIGAPIADRLAEVGIDIAVHDADPERVAAFGVPAGKDAVLGCEVLCVVTPDDAGLTELVGETGEGFGGTAVRTVLLHSTVLPERARALAAAFAAHGVTLVDAPVSGGPGRARTGSLTLLLGYDGDLEAARPVLDALADRVFLLGGAGAASAVKLTNQLVLFAALAGLHEGLTLAGAHGVGEEAVLEVLAASTGDSWAGRNLAFFDELARTYDDADAPADRRPWRKDLAEFVDAASAVALEAPFAEFLAGFVGQGIEARARAYAGTKGEMA